MSGARRIGRKRVLRITSAAHRTSLRGSRTAPCCAVVAAAPVTKDSLADLALRYAPLSSGALSPAETAACCSQSDTLALRSRTQNVCLS